MIENRTDEGSFEIKLDSDEVIETAGMLGFPVIHVSNEEMGWDEKPFIVLGEQ